MPQRVESSVVVEAPVDRVYDYWRNLENLPNFMSNIEDVRNVGDDRTQWRIKGPLNTTIEYTAETTQDEENSAIGWNSTGGDVQTSGQVRFQELGSERTRVEVTMNYSDPPGGRLGEVGSRLVANPQTMMDQDLQHFKEIMEGTSTPEEIQQRVSAVGAQSGLAAGLVAFLTSSAGLLVLGGLFLLVLLLRRGRGSSRRKSRIVFEL